MPRQILLADDSITIQKVIALTFAGEDYKITAVDNGADALTKAVEVNPDIVLADVVMPRKNGYEVCEALKKDPATSGIPVLLMAGTFEPFDEGLAKKVKADGFIIKPFESQALIQKVRELIGAKPGIPAAPAATAAPRPAAPAPPRPTAPPVKPPVVSAPGITPSAVKPQPVVTVPGPAVKPPVPPSAPAMAAPAPPSEEDFWGTMMEEVEESKTPTKVTVAPPEEEAAGEEIWEMGEFEEEVPAAEKEEEEVWESFAFEDAGEEAEEAIIPSEEEFAFAEEIAEEEMQPQVQFGEVAEEHIETEAEEFGFGERLPEAPAVPSIPIEPQPEIIQGYEQTFEPEAIGREVPAEAPVEPAAIHPSAVPLSEENLRAALSQVSREVIEKIVWEVVPDMAEMLIKEEIKRLQKKQ